MLYKKLLEIRSEGNVDFLFAFRRREAIEMDTNENSFELPPIVIGDLWGPSSLPDQFSKVPFATFSRLDKLGKCADFGGYMKYQYSKYDETFFVLKLYL